MDEDTDAPEVLVTGPDDVLSVATANGFFTSEDPSSKMVATWRPDLVVWGMADLSHPALAHTQKHGIPSVLIDAGVDGIMPTAGWVPGRLRKRLQDMDHLLTCNAAIAERVVRLGADEPRVEALGQFHDMALPLRADASELQAFGKAVAPRPIWLALDVPAPELTRVLRAHAVASRHAPRVLLILAMAEANDEAAAYDACRAHHFQVARWSEGTYPEDTHQVLLAEANLDIGQWIHLSPVTYMGGSLTNAVRTNPLSVAQLGSAVLHGPKTDPFSGAFDTLIKSEASCAMAMSGDLANSVEYLLAPDVAAGFAAAAWQVLSEGANVTNRLIDIIRGLPPRTSQAPHARA